MKKNSYTYEDLISCGNGDLFGPGNAKLPLPPMLMFDRITEISENKGTFSKGLIIAELDIKDNLWFFDCHFKNCLLYTSPSPRDIPLSRMPSSA